MGEFINVNAHIHTPYSFSAFSNIDEALDAAARENVRVVGINDFYSTGGYEAWKQGCEERKLFPLFNIEFIALNVRAQKCGERVNDPANPGRTYLSGKGLNCPPTLSGREAKALENVVLESNAQVERMCAKLNGHLAGKGVDIKLDFNEIRRTLTLGSIRERHLAKALRLAVEASVRKEDAAIVYEKIFGAEMKAPLHDKAAVENEIRSRLLKKGGAAFVEESPEAFLPVETVCDIIKAAGGLPTYPFLGDDAFGNFTDFEADLQKAADTLKGLGIRSAEFISTRNTTAVLESYASFLEDEGFVVSFGSEHNTPAMEPLTLRTRDSAELSPKLKAINYRGACAIAAHQAGLSGIVEGNNLIVKSIGLL